MNLFVLQNVETGEIRFASKLGGIANIARCTIEYACARAKRLTTSTESKKMLASVTLKDWNMSVIWLEHEDCLAAYKSYQRRNNAE